MRPGPPQNPILSDLAFANLPWRAAVRESLAHGRLPLWNRFVLAGNPLLGTAQAGILHPSTWLGVWLPVPLSWTFSCTFTLLLGLLAGFLFFRDFGLGKRAALVGAVGWGFSTYMVFWNGWSVGPSTATFPLLLLGLRRLAREPGLRATGLTVAALWLSFCGGHPESFFHSVAAGGVYFLWELAGAPRRQRLRAVAMALGAGGLALLLCGPQLFPLLEAIPHSAEYRARRQALGAGTGRQSVAAGAAVARLLPDVLPFSHGIYGKSPVDADRRDGSGMPIGYAGAVLFPLACLAFAAKPPARGRGMFLGLLAGGSRVRRELSGRHGPDGAAARFRARPELPAGLSRRPRDRGPGRVRDRISSRRAATRAGSFGSPARGVVAVFAVFLIARPVFASRGLSPEFTWTGLAFEIGPLLLLALGACSRGRRRGRAWRRPRSCCSSRSGSWKCEAPIRRFRRRRSRQRLPTLLALPIGGAPSRIVARGDVFRPNAAALYGIEDVRGYESLVLDRFADTFPLWSQAQAASFNRVDDLASSRPFLSLLNVGYAIGAPGDPVPEGWREQARGPELAIFANPGALPRAFVPRELRRLNDPAERLAAMRAAPDFAGSAFLAGAGPAEERNGDAALRIRESGPDLVVEATASARTFVATSLTDWPGWIAESEGRALPLETVNHAFVGFWLEPGRHDVRLTYRPTSWALGLAAFSAGGVLCIALALAAARRRPA